jgi:hypothetical protein
VFDDKIVFRTDEIPHPSAVCLSWDGEMLAAANEHFVVVRNIEDKSMDVIESPPRYYYAFLSFSDDSQYLVGLSEAPGVPRLVVWDLVSRKVHREVAGVREWIRPAVARLINRDTAVVGADDTVSVWNLNSGECLREVCVTSSESEWVLDVMHGTNGLLVARVKAGEQIISRVDIINVEKMAAVYTFAPEACTGVGLRLLSPDGKVCGIVYSWLFGDGGPLSWHDAIGIMVCERGEVIERAGVEDGAVVIDFAHDGRSFVWAGYKSIVVRRI